LALNLTAAVKWRKTKKARDRYRSDAICPTQGSFSYGVVDHRCQTASGISGKPSVENPEHEHQHRLEAAL